MVGFPAGNIAELRRSKKSLSVTQFRRQNAAEFLGVRMPHRIGWIG